MADADPACRAPTLLVWRRAPGRARPVRRVRGHLSRIRSCGGLRERHGEEGESRWGEGGGAAWGRDRSAAVPRATHARHAGATSVGSAPPMGCLSGDSGGGETMWRLESVAAGTPLGEESGGERGGGGGLGFGRACACGVGILGGVGWWEGVFAKVSGLYM
jgi:hypothetical protein